MTIYRLGLVCTLCTLGLAAPKAQPVAGYGNLPVHFERNQGQWEDGSLFTGIASRYRFSVDRQGFRMTLPSGELLGFRLVGGNADAAYVPGDALPGQSTYLLGAEASRQFRDIGHYRSVRGRAVYPGVDALYYGRGHEVEYDFVVAPYASADVIAMRVSGATRVSLDPNGDLVLGTPHGEARQRKPVAYQWMKGRKEYVEASYRLRDGAVRFELGPYDRSRALIIDPSLAYSVYFNTGGYSTANGIDVDAAGSAYVTGYVREGSVNRAYVVKLNATGDTILSSLFFTGALPAGIRIDATGAAYVVGVTDLFAPNALPVKKAIQAIPGGGYDFFAAKVVAAGNDFDYCTYVGGAKDEQMAGNPVMGVDAAGALYFIGTTSSTGMPVANALQGTLRGTSDAYLAKISPAGDRLEFATYFGTSGTDSGGALTLDRDGFVLFTVRSDLLTDLARGTTTYPSTANGLSYFGKLSASGQSLVYSGVLPVQATAIYPEATGDVLIGGTVATGAFSFTGTAILRLNAVGSALTTVRQYGTSTVQAITADLSGNIYAAGTGNSTDFLLRQIMGPGGGFEIFADAYLIKLTQAGTPVFATYVAGSENDYVSGLAVDSTGAAYLAGQTFSNDYPQVGRLSDKSTQPAAYVTKIVETPDQRITRVTILSSGDVGVKYSVDGVEYDRTKVFTWTPGTLHTLAVADVQFYRGVRYRFLNWSQGGLATQTYTVPDRDSATLTLTFERAVYLEANVYPAGAGTILLNPLPAADGYYPQGTSVTATVIPVAGYTLAGWTGRVTGTASTVVVAATPDTLFAPPSITANLTNVPQTHATAGLGYVAVRPCRVADTRVGEGKTGAFGPPHIAGQTIRSIPIPQGACGIPANAKAYAVNVTVVPLEPLAYISIWPTGRPQPLVSTLNAFEGQVAANAAIVPAGDNGSIDLFASNNTHAIVDINGYFTESTGTDVLYYYPLTPCRRADTRSSTPLQAGETRNFTIVGGCSVPVNARAFALNVTAVPRGPLAYVSVWPTGTTQPLVSTLNSFQGRVVANAAIVPAGTNGAVSVYAANATDMVLDVNGYFAPLSTGGLRFYAVQPCRVADTRTGEGFTAPNGPPALGANEPRTFSMLGRCGLPTLAQAYSLNVTVAPLQALGFLTLFPSASAASFGTSTLNAFEGQIVANAAITRGNAGGVGAFASNPTHLILDVNGYFAP